MNSKQEIAELLENSKDGFISGSAIADSLGITRAAVWKCIRQMEEEGYEIEATRKGYRLGSGSDAISTGSLSKYLGEYSSYYNIEVLDTVDSTNTYLKKRAHELLSKVEKQKDAPWFAVAADHQDAGRGRMGRSFVSPAGTGIYLSVLFRPNLLAQEAVGITTAAAVAACRAIEECTDSEPQIKWVNDVMIEGRKVCGILTEASMDLEGGGLDWAVIGIGFNVYVPKNGFLEEIKEIAGAIAGERERDLRSRMIASFLKHLYDLCKDLKGNDIAKEYKSRCFILGKEINVIKDGNEKPAVAYDIDDERRLLVRYPDGSIEALFSGEVSVRVIK